MIRRRYGSDASCGLYQCDRTHIDRTHVDPLHRKGDGLAGLLLCDHVEQRQIMLRGRRALVRVVAEGEIVDQGGVIAREQAVAHVLGTPLRPVESGTASTPVQAPQIVHDVAAADDEHALVAKRRLDWSGGGSAFDWAQRFSEHVRDRLLAGDHAALIDYLSFGDDAHESAPTPEHYLPLLYVIAQQQAGEAVTFPVEGIDMGAIDMRTVALI